MPSDEVMERSEKRGLLKRLGRGLDGLEERARGGGGTERSASVLVRRVS